MARGDPEGITPAGWTAFALGVGFMALMAAVMVVAPRLLVGAFLDITDPANPEVVELAVLVPGLSPPCSRCSTARRRWRRHAARPARYEMPMIYAAIGYWGIGLPLGAALAFWTGLRGSGIWIGLATGLTVVAILMMQRWLRRESLSLMIPGDAAPH